MGDSSSIKSDGIRYEFKIDSGNPNLATVRAKIGNSYYTLNLSFNSPTDPKKLKEYLKSTKTKEKLDNLVAQYKLLEQVMSHRDARLILTTKNDHTKATFTYIKNERARGGGEGTVEVEYTKTMKIKEPSLTRILEEKEAKKARKEAKLEAAKEIPVATKEEKAEKDALVKKLSIKVVRTEVQLRKIDALRDLIRITPPGEPPIHVARHRAETVDDEFETSDVEEEEEDFDDTFESFAQDPIPRDSASREAPIPDWLATFDRLGGSNPAARQEDSSETEIVEDSRAHTEEPPRDWLDAWLADLDRLGGSNPAAKQEDSSKTEIPEYSRARAEEKTGPNDALGGDWYWLAGRDSASKEAPVARQEDSSDKKMPEDSQEHAKTGPDRDDLPFFDRVAGNIPDAEKESSLDTGIPKDSPAHAEEKPSAEETSTIDRRDPRTWMNRESSTAPDPKAPIFQPGGKRAE